MIQPTIAVTGYRGIWGDTLTAEIAVRYATAFGQFVKSESPHIPTILIGRDGRESGTTIAEAIIPMLQAIGINVIYGDVLPTPTMMFAVQKHKYDGGIIITASHNPIEYNGIKFITKEARMTNEGEVEKIKKYLDERRDVAEAGLLGATATKSSEFSAENSSTQSGNIPSENKIPNFAKEHADHILRIYKCRSYSCS
jgi:phosphomannomutase